VFDPDGILAWISAEIVDELIAQQRAKLEEV
jgi:hypothetical protein